MRSASRAIVTGNTNSTSSPPASAARVALSALRYVFDPAVISGSSSSGSAVAVAASLAAFALGPDTAGSGRVPVALNNIVGIKRRRAASV